MFNCRTHRVPIYPWYFSPSPPSPWTDKRFLDALTSLDSKLSVSQSVIDVFRLAHLRVFQSYLSLAKSCQLLPPCTLLTLYTSSRHTQTTHFTSYWRDVHTTDTWPSLYIFLGIELVYKQIGRGAGLIADTCALGDLNLVKIPLCVTAMMSCYNYHDLCVSFCHHMDSSKLEIVLW